MRRRECKARQCWQAVRPVALEISNSRHGASQNPGKVQLPVGIEPVSGTKDTRRHGRIASVRTRVQ